MTIDQAIKQSKFASPTHKAVVNVIYTAGWLHDLQAPIFRKHGFQAQHFNVMRIVRGRHPEPVSPKEIIAVMLDKKRDLTRLLDKLQSLELVDRRPCPDNRRRMEVRLTEKGLAVLTELNAEVERTFFGRFGHLDAEEAEELSRLLDRLRG